MLLLWPWPANSKCSAWFCISYSPAVGKRGRAAANWGNSHLSNWDFADETKQAGESSILLSPLCTCTKKQNLHHGASHLDRETNTKRTLFLLPVPSCKTNWIYTRSFQWTMIFKKAEKVLSSYFFQLPFTTIFHHIYKLLQKLSRKSYILESFGWSTNQAIKKREGEKIY